MQKKSLYSSKTNNVETVKYWNSVENSPQSKPSGLIYFHFFSFKQSNKNGLSPLFSFIPPLKPTITHQSPYFPLLLEIIFPFSPWLMHCRGEVLQNQHNSGQNMSRHIFPRTVNHLNVSNTSVLSHCDIHKAYRYSVTHVWHACWSDILLTSKWVGWLGLDYLVLFFTPDE